MKPLRIAVWHNLPSGGGKRALYDQVQGLKARGHYLEAWCPPTVNQRFLPLEPIIKEHVVPLNAPLPLLSSPLCRRPEMAWRIARRMAMMEEHCRRCGKEIAAGSFDVLLSHPCQFFRASPIAKYCQIPKVIYLQEPFRELYEAWPEFPWAALSKGYRPLSPRYWKSLLSDIHALHGRRIQVREERAWVGSYDQILVNSLFSRESMLRTYNLDSRVCYLGVDTGNFRPTAAAKEFFIIGLGNIFFNKRPLVAVQAVGTMPVTKRPKLIWVGNFADDRCLNEVRSEARRVGVDFEFKVLIPDDELRNLLGRAAVMIYTSHLEPFGYAPLEANACGTGVVAIAEGGVRETVGNPLSGVLVPGNDPKALAEAMLPFTDNLGFAADFGRKARGYVESCWSQVKAMERLETELERALTRGNQSTTRPLT